MTSKMDIFVSSSGAEIIAKYETIAVSDAGENSADEEVSAFQCTGNGRLILSGSQTNRIQVVLSVVVRLVLPVFNGVTRSLQGIRGISILDVLRNVKLSRQLLSNLLAFAANRISLNLSTVPVVHKLNPLLRMIKLRKNTNTIPPPKPKLLELPDHNYQSDISIPIVKSPKLLMRQQSGAVVDDPPEKCVTLNVLAEPPPGCPIRADVVFIHGLHGSLVNTWKQGVWNSAGRRVHFQRPPRPPVRPPKRHRRSRTTLFDPPHRSKRPKIGSDGSESPSAPDSPNDSEALDSISSYYSSLDDTTCPIDYSYECDNIDGVDLRRRRSKSTNSEDEYLTELEQHFPAFRLRDEEEDDDLPNDDDDDSAGSDRSSASRNDGYSRCWPGDWLPLDCPGVRVIAVNYTTDPYLWRPMFIRKRNRTSLLERSREMMDLLTAQGVGDGHPIVWVGHSKGGIFIKQIMVDAWESGKASVAPLWQSSRGCVFYSVPHRGSPLADFNLPLVRQSVELVEIKKNCPGVLELHRRFVALYRGGHLKVQIFSFVETALTLMSVLYLRIVGIDSADPGIGEVCGVHLDHREICKPRDRDCMLYTKLTKMINRVS